MSFAWSRWLTPVVLCARADHCRRSLAGSLRWTSSLQRNVKRSSRTYDSSNFWNYLMGFWSKTITRRVIACVVNVAPASQSQCWRWSSLSWHTWVPRSSAQDSSLNFILDPYHETNAHWYLRRLLRIRLGRWLCMIASKVFSSLSVFQILQENLHTIFGMIPMIIQGKSWLASTSCVKNLTLVI